MTQRSQHGASQLLFVVSLWAALWSAVGCSVPADDSPDMVTEVGAPASAPATAAGLGYDTPFLVDGLRTPLAVTAEQADLTDDARVIGVSLGDRHRAYSITALSAMTSHVVNDLLSGTPISVTYCNQTDCTRVFTRDQPSAPIDLGIGGWMNGQMSLRYGGQHYPQSSDQVPLEDFPFTVTTWRDWRETHPDTDVYTGSQPRTEPVLPPDVPGGKPAPQ